MHQFVFEINHHLRAQLPRFFFRRPTRRPLNHIFQYFFKKNNSLPLIHPHVAGAKSWVDLPTGHPRPPKKTVKKRYLSMTFGPCPLSLNYFGPCPVRREAKNEKPTLTLQDSARHSPHPKIVKVKVAVEGVERRAGKKKVFS